MSDEDGRSPEFRRGRPRSGTEADAAGACGEVKARVIALYRGRQRVRQLVVAVQVVELEIVDKRCAGHADRQRERRASFLPRSAGTGAAKALFGAKTGSLSRNLVPGRLGRNRKRASSSTRERDRVRCSRVAAGCRARGSMVAIAATEGSVRRATPRRKRDRGSVHGRTISRSTRRVRGGAGGRTEFLRASGTRRRGKSRRAWSTPVSPRERDAKRDGPGEERLRLQRPRTGSRQTVTSDNVCGSRERDRPTLGVAFPNSPG